MIRSHQRCTKSPTAPRRDAQRAWRRALWIALVLMSSSCAWLGFGQQPDDADARRKAAGALEEQGPLVSDITWEGVEAISRRELERRIVTTEPLWIDPRIWREKPHFDPYILEDDKDRIVAAYHERGYYGAQVEAKTTPSRDEKRVAVHFIVYEGDPVRLTAWTLAVIEEPAWPLEPAERAELMGLLPRSEAEPGEEPRIFGSELYRTTRAQLLARCADLGFPAASLDGGAEVDAQQLRAEVSWRLTLGARATISAIRVRGLTQLDDEIVRRELRFEVGDRYSAAKLRESEKKLVETGLFRLVAIRARPRHGGDPSRYVAVVRVEERPPQSVRVGVGYGTEDQARGQVAYAHRNFLGDGRHLDLRGRASFLEQGLDGRLHQPYLWGDLWSADLSLSGGLESRRTYDAIVADSELLVNWTPVRDGPLQMFTGPRMRRGRVTDFGIEEDSDLRGPRNAFVNGWVNGIAWSKLDQPSDPHSGRASSLRFELGGFVLGSDVNYSQIDLDLRQYFPLGPLVFALRGAAGTMVVLGGDRSDVPVFRRYYSGGSNSVRGFQFQRLGPLDNGNEPLGGLSIAEGSAELRFPIWKKLGGVIFSDAGEVREGDWSWRANEIRYSAGVGLRLSTPVGPIRVDWGYLLNPPRDFDPWKIHLSVGHAF